MDGSVMMRVFDEQLAIRSCRWRSTAVWNIRLSEPG